METHSPEFDVVIMGAGFGGICQARHLLLKMPELRVALIDPRPTTREDKDMKIGESTVEVAALFISRELGLYDYMIENHTPKHGLNFHWPKDASKTETLDDYYHVLINRQVAIPAFHLNRAKFEEDVLAMTLPMGVTYFQGHVTDVDLPEGNATKTVYVKMKDGEAIELSGKYVIDAAGRKQIIGKKKDNIISGPENLRGLNNGSAWVRIRNVDRKIFFDGYSPERSTTSAYYTTNHWFGPGHWLWMIPSDSENMELSIGVVHHHDVIPSEQLNRKQKFYNFLEANHNILYQIVEDADDVDFYYWPKIAHKSKEMFSKDNWFVLGDAAYIFDAFYSYGSSTIAFAVESITEIIRAQRAGEKEAEEKRRVYNEFNVMYGETINSILYAHDKHLGNASIMSWRIFYEYIWWFGLHVPMYFGKWHLDLLFVKTFLKTLPGHLNGLNPDIYDTFSELIDRGESIGLLDAYREDQLFPHYNTTKHFDHYLENSKTEPLMVNVFAGLRNACFYTARYYAALKYRTYGWRWILQPKSQYQVLRLIGIGMQTTIGKWYYEFVTRKLPPNSEIAAMRKEAEKYRYIPALQPWKTDSEGRAASVDSQSNGRVPDPMPVGAAGD